MISLSSRVSIGRSKSPFGGHGDHDDLVNFVKQQNPADLKKAFLVHGEVASMESLHEALANEDYQAEIAVKGRAYLLE